MYTAKSVLRVKISRKVEFVQHEKTAGMAKCVPPHPPPPLSPVAPAQFYCTNLFKNSHRVRVQLFLNCTVTSSTHTQERNRCQGSATNKSLIKMDSIIAALNREGFIVSIGLARTFSVRLYLCISAVSKLSSRTIERETTDSYKQIVDLDNGAWSEFQPAHRHVAQFTCEY